MTFGAEQCFLTGTWWVSCSWPRCRYRYGGTSWLWPVPADDPDPEATARAVAEDLQGRLG